MKLFKFLLLTLLITSTSFAKDVIKIGAILPMTGNNAFIGEDIQRGLYLALDEINNDPKNKYRYEVIVEDNAFENKRAVLATQKLLNIDKVDIVLSLWADNTSVVAPIVNKSKAWNASICWDPTIAANNPKTVIFETSIDEYMKGFVNLAEEMKYKKIAIVGMKAYSFEVAINKIKELIANKPTTISAIYRFNPGERNFKSIIGQITKDQPDVVMVFSYVPEMELFLKEYKDLGVKTPLTGAFEAVQDTKLLEGKVFYDHGWATEDFKKKFRDRYNQDYTIRAPDAYDFMKMISLTYEASPAGKKPTAEEAVSQIQKLTYSGALGVVKIQNRTATPQAQKVTVKDGKKIKL